MISIVFFNLQHLPISHSSIFDFFLGRRSRRRSGNFRRLDILEKHRITDNNIMTLFFLINFLLVTSIQLIRNIFLQLQPSLIQTINQNNQPHNPRSTSRSRNNHNIHPSFLTTTCTRPR